MKNVICKKCQEAGLTSKVWPGMGFSTLLAGDAYWDENGIWHDHDPNSTEHSYHCSNDHRWSETTYHECEACKVIKECVCTKTCDCDSPDGDKAACSNECPVHNDIPRPNPDCKAKKHWFQLTGV